MKHRQKCLLSNGPKKTDNLYIRDYWGITDWQKDLPGFGPIKIKKRLDYWKKFPSIKGVHAESSYSIGALGMIFFYSGITFWNLNESKTAKNDLLPKLFPNSNKKIEKYFDVSGLKIPSNIKIPKLFKILNDAYNIANEIEKERIKELIKYCIYLELYHEFKMNSNVKKAEKLLKFIWLSYESKIIHTSRLNNLIINKFMNKDPYLQSKYNLRKKSFNRKTWKNILLDSNNVEDVFLHRSYNVDESNFQYKDSICEDIYPKFNFPSSNSFSIMNKHTLGFHNDGRNSVIIQIKLKKLCKNNNTPHISLKNDFGELVQEIKVKNNTLAQEILFNLQGKGPYKIVIGVKNANINIVMPANLKWWFENQLQLVGLEKGQNKFKLWIPVNSPPIFIKGKNLEDSIRLINPDIEISPLTDSSIFQLKYPLEEEGKWIPFF